MTFTAAETDYLRSQLLGRLCTLGPTGAPQVRPVGVHLGPEGTIDVYGFDLDKSQKWRNVQADPRVSFVVDDLASRNPWITRGIEIRGNAEALVDGAPPKGGMSGTVIRIHPRRVLSWGINEPGKSVVARDV